MAEKPTPAGADRLEIIKQQMAESSAKLSSQWKQISAQNQPAICQEPHSQGAALESIPAVARTAWKKLLAVLRSLRREGQ